jgi:hypothetical protein
MKNLILLQKSMRKDLLTLAFPKYSLTTSNGKNARSLEKIFQSEVIVPLVHLTTSTLSIYAEFMYMEDIKCSMAL